MLIRAHALMFFFLLQEAFRASRDAPDGFVKVHFSRQASAGIPDEHVEKPTGSDLPSGPDVERKAEGEIGGPGPAHSLESAAGLAAASEVMKHYFPPFADMDLQPPAGMDNAVRSPLCIPLRQSLRYWLESAQSSSIVNFAV